MSTDGSKPPTEGRMNAVLSTLREALRPADAPRQPRQSTTTTTQAQHEDSLSPARQAEQQYTPPGLASHHTEHDTSFTEAHRDATGHTSVLESIMPGHQGLAGKEPWDPSSGSPPKKERRGSGLIMGALEGWTRRRSSAAAATAADGDDASRVRSDSNASGGHGGGGDYTFSGSRRDTARTGESAQPRAMKMDNNIIMASQEKETTRDSINKLPGSVARDSQVSR